MGQKTNTQLWEMIRELRALVEQQRIVIENMKNEIQRLKQV